MTGAVIALEVRDRMTFIPVLAIRPIPLTEPERYLFHSTGWRGAGCIVTRLSDGSGHSDAYAWSDRTMRTAHEYIDRHFDELSDGDVVDVEHILGETTAAKGPQRLEAP